jgi:glycosyltransferase involved in cell wall biosynthesis
MSEQPLLTILLPVFNGGEFLAEAVSSLLAQTYANFRLVISDNASNDQTSSICELYRQKDSRILYIRHSLNRGAYWNFAHFLPFVETPYFMWAACDDLWHPDFISLCLKQLISDSDIAVVSSLVVPFGVGLTTETCSQLSGLSGQTCWQSRFGFLCQPEEYGKANIVYGIFRTSVVKSVAQRRLFDECWGTDMLFVYRCLTYGKLLVLDQPLFYKRQASTACPEFVQTPSKPSEHERYAISAFLATLRRYWAYYWSYVLIDLGDQDISIRIKIYLLMTSVYLFIAKIWPSFQSLIEMVIRHKRDALMKVMHGLYHKVFRHKGSSR